MRCSTGPFIRARRCRLWDWAPSARTDYSGEEVAAAVRGAIERGYHHIDFAAVYGNEALVGGAPSDAMAGGVPRDDLWITSKLWNDKHSADDVVPSCRQSLAYLQLDYLDLYLVHWPFPNFHVPACSFSIIGSSVL
ncbi:MAG: aldo/keto reductase [Candidatus Hydrogenedentes bacterium]|nr:aldo/keto reductase [Candidatus Hydrogenedentota bacterium]